MRASERSLKVRLRSLTNELAVYKRKAIAAEHGPPSGGRPGGRYARAGGDNSYRYKRATYYLMLSQLPLLIIVLTLQRMHVVYP